MSNKNDTPISAIEQAVSDAKNAPRKVGLLSVKTANAWVDEAMKTPDPKMFFRNMIVQNENTVIFAASNVGKSILAIQMAEEIAMTEKILYIDLELSAKQFQMRYSDFESGMVHHFPQNFTRAEIDPELIVGNDIEQEILNSMEDAAKQGIKFFVVDNITFICNDSEKGVTAGSFMMKLIRLKKRYGLTNIIVAHTPKRRGWDPITQSDLAGSAKLMNFFDAGIAVARSAKDPDLRYIKQVKVRTGEFQFGEDNVLICEVLKENGFLHFAFQGCDEEENHLRRRPWSNGTEEIIEILKLQRAGKSIRQIAEILGISKSSVTRKIQKAKANNITIPEETVPSVPPVPQEGQKGRPGQEGQVTDPELPLTDENN